MEAAMTERHGNTRPARKAQRRLHVYRTGDPYREGIRPQIRLTGRWLQEAGFGPGDTYTVIIHQEGIITLQTERARLRSLP
jgi:hypothetical protein